MINGLDDGLKMRPGSEVLGLRWRDLDFKAGTMQVEHELGTDGTLQPLKSAASASVVRLLTALAREWGATSRDRHGWA